MAVLPFDVAPGDAYLADGVREDLIDSLSATSTLRVRPAGIVAVGSDPRAVGRALEVDHVVVGSVKRAGDKLRVMARLVGIEDGFQIWAHRVMCTDAEILAVSETLATGIATALSTRADVGDRPTDPRAVELFLRARAELRRFWGDHAVTAMKLLAEAVEISPSSIPILTAYAMACAQAYAKTGEPALLPRARAVVDKALATGHGEAHLAAATLAWSVGDIETMPVQLGTAVTRAPMSAAAHEMAGRFLLEVAPIAEGKKHLDLALGLEPQREPMVSLELARMAALEGDLATVDQRVAKLCADPDVAFQRIGAMAEARLSAWTMDLSRTIVAAERLGDKYRGNVSSTLVEVVARFARGESFDEALWQDAMHRLAHNELSTRQRLVTYQRAVECAAIVGRFEEALDALVIGNRLGLLDINWLDGCPLFRAYANDARWRAQRDVLAARAERVLTAFRTASA